MVRVLYKCVVSVLICTVLPPSENTPHTHTVAPNPNMVILPCAHILMDVGVFSMARDDVISVKGTKHQSYYMCALLVVGETVSGMQPLKLASNKQQRCTPYL